MRTVALLAWLMIPVLVGAYHYGPGQEKLQLDEVAQLLSEADRLAGQERWADASSRYDRALSILPSGRVDEARRIRLEKAKVQMMNRQLPEANLALKELVDQLESDKQADVALRDEAREALANSQYYLTWLMRLEGLGAADWEPEIESSRQIYRMLAEQAETRGDRIGAKAHREDLESSIRLARLDLSELQGLDIPKQCKGCKSGQCRKPSKSKGKGPQGKQEPKDARGAGSGPPPDDSGS